MHKLHTCKNSRSLVPTVLGTALAGMLAVCAGVTESISIFDNPVQHPSAAPSDSSSSSSATAESQNRESSGRSQESILQPHVVVEEAVADNAVQADDTQTAESSGATLKVIPRAPLTKA
jgi:hypothetical protein